MNEIERLRELRAGLPPARPESRAAARAGLLARIEHEQAPPRPHASAWRHRRLRLVALALALAAVLVVLPLALFGGSGTVQPAVAQVLHRAAEVAAAQQPLDPRSDQFVYTRSQGAYLQGTAAAPHCKAEPCEATHHWSVLIPSTREAWISLDGVRQGRVREVTGKPRFVSADQRAGWVAAGKPPLSRPGRVEDSSLSGSGGVVDGSHLPTDPDVLREQIEARATARGEGPSSEVQTFERVGDMLHETNLPPAVRAALFEVTAALPGVELLGDVEDPIGRPGTGVAFTDAARGTRHELIFDPETSALLGEQVSLTGAKELYDFAAPAGTVIGYAAYLETRVVDSVGEDAPAGAGAFESSVACHDAPTLRANTAVVHGADPIATCLEVWREGAMDTSRGPQSPDLVACVKAGEYVAQVFPSSDPKLCTSLNLVPFDPSWRR